MAVVRSLLYRSPRSIREFSTTAVCESLRNFRKFPLHGFRGGRRFREKMRVDPDPDIPVYDYGVRQPGYTYKGKFHIVPEMVPEIIVPDLTGFQLKPYVSYRVKDVVQSEFTARDLFSAIYARKIVTDYKNGKLDENGNPMEPNEYEALTAEEAKIRARKAGSDYFDSKPSKYNIWDYE